MLERVLVDESLFTQNVSPEMLPNDGIERRVLITEQQLEQRVSELGRQISEDYKDKNPLLIGVLNGSFIFMADLAKKLDPDLGEEFEFMQISSYNGTESSREPKIIKDLNTDIGGRNVLIVEDVVDTGYSMDALLKILAERNAASVKICALLSKPEMREVEVPIAYLGFEIPKVWVEGYGLDTDKKFRGLPFVVYRVPHDLQKAN